MLFQATKLTYLHTTNDFLHWR